MLENIGEPTSKELAKTLGLSERTIRNYRAKGKAPRPVLLALFWVTSYGRSWAHTDAHNDAVMAQKTALSLQNEIENLKRVIRQLIKHKNNDCANDPVNYPGVSLRDRALLLRNEAPCGSSPVRVTIPDAHYFDGKRS